MPKRFTDTEKWKKGYIRSLPTKYKLLWLYILDDCNHAGVWDVDLEVAEIRIGSKINKKEAIKYYSENIKIFDNDNKWFIPKFIDFQYGQLNENVNAHKSVIKLIDKYDLYSIGDVDLSEISPLDTGELSKPLIKKFKKPTIEEVKEYCLERGNNINPETFIDFYESNGWKVGKNSMKDWRASLRTWEKNSTNSNKSSKVENQIDSWQKARDIVNNS
jgi:hypothetical protein|tara:strand:+ start:180 stop:830 length:651 start_codon:yes stop_codon:yes gene_type:complete